jgi:hypothetical protein
MLSIVSQINPVRYLLEIHFQNALPPTVKVYVFFFLLVFQYTLVKVYTSLLGVYRLSKYLQVTSKF